MASRKTEHTPADYVVMALAPALIMALVGSLVFFLLEVLYAGAYPARLQWLLFFFVFGAVLIARISMQPDIAGRARFYGGILGLLVWVGLLTYVEYPPDNPVADFGWAINLGLIALIWWCAHQLTWDCTFLDDREGSAGKGVLQAAGFEEGSQPQEEERAEAEEGEPAPAPAEKRTPLNWLERYHAYREKRRQKRTPGVWVVYFSLAALPIFGLGQAFIPVEAGDRRRYTFWLMAVYVGSGLGLLLTTTFLGLRLYLQRRKLRMPAAMTGVWLTLGGLLIALFLLAGALLPRPRGEYQLFDRDRAGSKARQASRANVKRGESGEGKGDAKDAKDGKDQGKEQGQGDKKGDQKDGKAGKDAKKDKADKDAKKGSGKPKKDGGDKTDEKDADRDTNSPPRAQSSSWWKGLAKVLKWVVFGILALVVLFFVVRNFLQFLSNFTSWARDLLDALRRFWESLLGLFGSKKEGAVTEETAEAAHAAVALRPFAAFANPFADGRAEQLSTHELTCYTFAALQAWARERDLGRQSGETPLEFAGRVGEEVPPLESDLQRLAVLYARAVYARGGLPPNSREVLQSFWETLSRTAEQPLSA